MRSQQRLTGSEDARHEPPFTLIRFSIYLDFVRLHDFLDGLADVTQAHVDSCTLGEIQYSGSADLCVKYIYS